MLSVRKIAAARRDFKELWSNPSAMPAPSAHVEIALATIKDKKAAAEPAAYPRSSARWSAGDNSQQARITDSNCRNALNLSFARTTKRFPFSPPQIHQQRRLLKKSKEFEDDHDDDNYSNDIEDVSVHTGDSYQSECAVARIYPDLAAPWLFCRGAASRLGTS